LFVESITSSEPFLVSRTGDAGCSDRKDKAPKCTLI